MFKNKLILFSLFFISCNVVDSVDVIENEITEEIKENIPQQIYLTSLQNHEWNNGWFNQINDLVIYGGTSYERFMVGSVYFDYDNDGDFDMFVTLEHEINRLGIPIEGTEYKNIVLRNDGKNSNNFTIWKSLDVVNTQPKKIYRRLLPGDVNNDGFIDIVAFVAEDPEYKNEFRTMGGMDIFLNDGNGRFNFKEIIRYQEGHEYFFHGATLGDVNNDGLIDIIGFSNGLKVFLNDNGNISSEYIQLKVYEPNVYDNDLADFYAGEVFDINQDGYLDLILGTSKKPWFDSYNNYYSDEDYGKHTEIVFGIDGYPFFDFNSKVKLYHDYDFTNKSDWIQSTYCCAMDYSINDYDNDGDYDIFVLVNRDESEIQSYKSMISYYENDNNQKWIPKTESVFEADNQFVAGGLSLIKLWDIDNDGNKELLIENTERAGFTAWKKNQNNKLYKTKLR